MSDVAIRVEQVSKQYAIGTARRRYRTLREHIVDSVLSFGRRRSEQTFWALRDVSFEVRPGEVIGIVGPNGAGKSTLLKILSRITEPSAGRVQLHGRVGSLLEVGTGFHSELTGRENVYLNGAILGMSKSDIDRKFDEIVGFAETGQFIDTPIKHYSSGMQMRLGFAVAAHLEPDILIVDEVLAVGDLEFQNRCLGKMQSVATQGRTVLFVSHNMGAVANLCTSALWLDAGRMVTQGPVAETIAAYIQSVGGARDNDVSRWTHKGTGEARFLDGQPVDADGSPRTTFAMGESVVVELEMEVCRTLPVHQLAVVIKRAESGLPVLHLLSDDSGTVFRNLAVGKHRFSFELPNCLLYPGVYTVTLVAHSSGNVLDRVENALGFSMVQSGAVGRTTAFRSHLGVFHSPSIWRQM